MSTIHSLISWQSSFQEWRALHFFYGSHFSYNIEVVRTKPSNRIYGSQKDQNRSQGGIQQSSEKRLNDDESADSGIKFQQAMQVKWCYIPQKMSVDHKWFILHQIYRLEIIVLASSLNKRTQQFRDRKRLRLERLLETTVGLWKRVKDWMRLRRPQLAYGRQLKTE